MSCPNDTDHDGDCHLCHRLPGGCFLRDVAAPLQNLEPKFCLIDELDQRPLRFLECPTPQSQSKPVLDHLMTEIQTRTGCTTSN